LRALQAELSALENELADPSNPLLHKEREEDNVDPGELIRGLVDVRGRIEKIRKGKEGRGKLVGLIVGSSEADMTMGEESGLTSSSRTKEERKTGREARREDPLDVRNIVEMDRRVGELEKLVGSSGAALDEVRTPFTKGILTSLLNHILDITPPTPASPPNHTSQHTTDAPHTTPTHRLHLAAAQAPSLRSRPSIRIATQLSPPPPVPPLVLLARPAQLHIRNTPSAAYPPDAVAATHPAHPHTLAHPLDIARLRCGVSEHP
jgi:hypothetical protein